jgi:hypothetical protein
VSAAGRIRRRDRGGQGSEGEVLVRVGRVLGRRFRTLSERLTIRPELAAATSTVWANTAKSQNQRCKKDPLGPEP